MARRGFGFGYGRRRRVGGVASALPALKAYTSTIAVYDPSDLLTMWQDRAGTTTQAVIGQPIGHMKNVKTGATALHMTAMINDGRRPVLTNGGLYDGVDDGMHDAATSGLPANATLIALVRTTDTAGILWARTDNTALIVSWNTTAGNISVGAGSPTIKVDGVAKTTRQDLSAALSDNVTHTVLVESADLSTWNSIGIANFSGGIATGGNLVHVVSLDASAGDYAAALVSAQAWVVELKARLGL